MRSAAKFAFCTGVAVVLASSI
ncbi:MAG: hypothetical protein QOF78_361, partial [Phycisphaerales bacterium]|nr:hypothetical protein [Phycisphaerales bacterium]